MIKKIAFTFYPVTDIQRARAFYEEALGLTVSDNYEDQWIEFEVGGGVLALSSMVPNVRPAADAGGSVAFEVDDVDALVAKLRERGVPVLVEPFSTPVCRMCVVQDPEGNALTLHQVTDL